MKKTLFIALALALASLAAPALAADFLGLPLPEGGAAVTSDSSTYKATYDLPAPELYKRFQETLKGEADIKQHELRGELLLEDFGARPWNKVIISAAGPAKSILTITKDSWTWIVGMLTLRFTGVFIVLLVLYVAMSLATLAISRSLARKAKQA